MATKIKREDLNISNSSSRASHPSSREEENRMRQLKYSQNYRLRKKEWIASLQNVNTKLTEELTRSHSELHVLQQHLNHAYSIIRFLEDESGRRRGSSTEASHLPALPKTTYPASQSPRFLPFPDLNNYDPALHKFTDDKDLSPEKMSELSKYVPLTPQQKIKVEYSTDHNNFAVPSKQTPPSSMPPAHTSSSYMPPSHPSVQIGGYDKPFVPSSYASSANAQRARASQAPYDINYNSDLFRHKPDSYLGDERAAKRVHQMPSELPVRSGAQPAQPQSSGSNGSNRIPSIQSLLNTAMDQMPPGTTINTSTEITHSQDGRRRRSLTAIEILSELA